MSTKDKALELIAEVGSVPAADLRPQMDLMVDLGIDSPKALQLLVSLEDHLGAEISDEDASHMKTVGDVVAYVERVAS